jgi:hypothetical protein
MSYVLVFVLLPASLFVLVKTGKKNQFAKKVATLMIAACLSSLISRLTYDAWLLIHEVGILYFVLLVISFVAYTVQMICFNETSWIFAFEYYKVSKVVPLAVQNQQVPDDLKTSLSKTYRVLLLANMIIPIASGCLYIVIDIDVSMSFYYILQVCLITVEIVILLLQIISASFLAIAINNIRKFMSNQVNTC